MIVFTVTTIDIIGDPVLGIRRTPGIFTTLDEALTVVKNNMNDISDSGIYQYAVIEETTLNKVRPFLQDGIRMWFRYNSVLDEFEECDTLTLPNQLSRLHGFGIG